MRTCGFVAEALRTCFVLRSAVSQTGNALSRLRSPRLPSQVQNGRYRGERRALRGYRARTLPHDQARRTGRFPPDSQQPRLPPAKEILMERIARDVAFVVQLEIDLQNAEDRHSSTARCCYA